MQSSIFSNDTDLQDMQALIDRLAANLTLVDFDEQIQLASVRAATRLWRQSGQLIGFAYVDDYNNLWFETEPEWAHPDELEAEIVAWGVTCIQQRNAETGEDGTLDCACSAAHRHRVQMLEKHGFQPAPERSLRYARSLAEPVAAYPLPAGFSLRCAAGPAEVEALVALHRAAFGTDHMTVEERLAMMNAPQYAPDMDFVAVAPTGELAAFCVCGFADPDKKTGYTDPIGTHPQYQRLGLGQAIVSAGLGALKMAGAQVAELGTSSLNPAMQKLAGKLGFVCVAEKLWFSKTVS
jgi:ribosomal protein S18 acetylase RimI-like enzyme